MTLIKITTLYDNRCSDPSLQEGWGFSVLIEYDNYTLLFDTGAYPHEFFSNCETLNINFHKITHVVISHRHYDHVGSFDELLRRLKSGTKIVLPKWCFCPWKKQDPQFEWISSHSFQKIEETMFSLVLNGGFFLYEQSLILETSKGNVIITGCAHPGIIPIVKAAQENLSGKIRCVFGGFHLAFTPSFVTKKIVEEFRSLGVEMVAPCHCTGDHAIRQFKETYGNDCYTIGTGSIVFV